MKPPQRSRPMLTRAAARHVVEAAAGMVTVRMQVFNFNVYVLNVL